MLFKSYFGDLNPRSGIAFDIIVLASITCSIDHGKIKRKKGDRALRTVRYVTSDAHTSGLPANLIPLTMCTRRNLLTSLSRLLLSVGLFLLPFLSFSLFSFPFFHMCLDHYHDRSLVNCRIYRFWI